MSTKSVSQRIVLLSVIALLSIVLGNGIDFAVAQQVEKPALTRWKETGVIRVGWAPWSSFSFRDPKTGEVRGILIDFFKILATEINLKTEFVEDSWGTFIAGLKANKFDVFSSGNITVPRAMEMGFTDGYMKIPAGFVVTKDWLKAHPNIKNFWDLDKPEITIATSKGGRTDMLITKNFKRANINRIKGSLAEEIMEIKSKRADAGFDTGLAILAAIKEQPGLAMVPGTFGGQPLAIGVRQGDFVTTHFLNIWIADAKREGVIKKLFEQYWGGIPEAAPEDYLME